MDTKERYLGERDDTDWQALSLHVPLIPTIITITIASRWTVLNSFAAHTQPARGKTARRKKIPVQLMFRWRITCLGVSKCMRLSKKKKKKKSRESVPVIYIISVSATIQQTCLHENVRQFQVERSRNEIQCSALSQQSCRRARVARCAFVCACARLSLPPVILHQNTIPPSEPRAKISLGKRSNIDW